MINSREPRLSFDGGQKNFVRKVQFILKSRPEAGPREITVSPNSTGWFKVAPVTHAICESHA